MAYKRKPYRTGLEEGYRLGYEAAIRQYAANVGTGLQHLQSDRWQRDRAASLDLHMARNRAEARNRTKEEA